ncbi:carboxypeptidase-like regulatory domain-containing protein [Ferruginibacter sp.]|nr:TonB-dependent receptor [Ferruginibacter sp.]
MKYITLTLLTVFSIAINVQAQPGTGRISGIISDTVTGTSMESATVIIYKPDSTVFQFKITDKNGRYEITGLPLQAKFLLVASFAGYNEFRMPFTMDAAVKKMDTVFLQTKTSNEVIITSIAPIRMNGDTLEINPAAFKMANDAVAEDLLNKVPGIVIWADGSITMNGKTIPKVLVDGKPFLGNSDHRIATQNLPKNIIDKIQLYNEVDMGTEASRSQITDGQAPKDSMLTMDIRLKADKKNGYFGKYGAGYGTDKRYSADAALQFYNKRSTLAVGGGANNINAEIAGLNDTQRESTFRNNYATFRSRSNFGRNGINRVISPGIQFTHSFSQNENERRTNRINGGYDYDNNSGNANTQTYQERYLTTGDQIINSFSENVNQSQRHALKMNYGKSLDYNKRFSVSANGATGNSYAENTSGSVIKTRQDVTVSDRSSNSQTNANSKSFNTTLNYTNFDSENPLKAFDANASFVRSENASDRNENTVYNFYDSTGVQNTLFKRHSVKETSSTSFNSALTYSGLKRLLFGRFNFFGIDISTNHNVSYQKNDDDNKVFDIDVSQKENSNKNLTYNETFSTFQYVPSLSLSKNFNKWSSRKSSFYSLRTGANKQFINEENTSSRTNRNINRSFSFLRFNAGASYSHQVINVYRLSGNLSYENGYGYSSINQIAPVVDSSNLYSLYKGGLNLVNSKNNNLNANLSFSTINPKRPTQFNLNFNGSLSNVLKPFVDSTLNSLNGKQIRYTINGNKRNNSYFNYSASFSRKIKGNQVQVQYNGNINKGMSPSYIDNLYTVINTTSYTQSFRFNYYYKTIVITGVSINTGASNSRQTGYNNKNFNTRNFSGEFNVTVNVHKDASISSNLAYSQNNGIVKPITIWNANSSYRFLKSKQAELKFTATDILKQFKNISYVANDLGVTSSVSNGLQQYFMVTLSYFPRKFGGGNGRAERNNVRTENGQPNINRTQGGRGNRRG